MNHCEIMTTTTMTVVTHHADINRCVSKHIQWQLLALNRFLEYFMSGIEVILVCTQMTQNMVRFRQSFGVHELFLLIRPKPTTVNTHE